MVKFLLTIALLFTTIITFSQNSVSVFPKIEFERETVVVKPLNVDTLEVRFTAKNIGGSTLELTSVKPSCGCTVVDYPKTIGAGQQVYIMVKIANPTPPFTKSVLVNSNDPEHPDVVLYIKSEIN